MGQNRSQREVFERNLRRREKTGIKENMASGIRIKPRYGLQPRKRVRGWLGGGLKRPKDERGLFCNDCNANL